jgi:hypothetical protein
MRISDLQKYLAAVKRKHGDIEVIENRYSDFMSMDPIPTDAEVQLTTDDSRYGGPSKWAVIEAASRQDGEYLMRDHSSLRALSLAERDAMGFKRYLLYRGN